MTRLYDNMPDDSDGRAILAAWGLDAAKQHDASSPLSPLELQLLARHEHAFDFLLGYLGAIPGGAPHPQPLVLTEELRAIITRLAEQPHAIEAIVPPEMAGRAGTDQLEDWLTLAILAYRLAQVARSRIAFARLSQLFAVASSSASHAPLTEWLDRERARMQARDDAGEEPLAFYTPALDTTSDMPASYLVAGIRGVEPPPLLVAPTPGTDSDAPLGAERWLVYVRHARITDPVTDAPVVQERLLLREVYDTLDQALARLHTWGFTEYARGETDPASWIDREMCFFACER